MKLSNDTNIVIVGLGLMGGSYAKALTKKGFKVYGISDNEKSLEYAKNSGIIVDGSSFCNPEIISKGDIVIFCLYPEIFVNWIKENKNMLKSGAVITDVTGIKSSIVYKIQDMLGNNAEYIAAHPMAGRESSGIENSDCSIFTDANYIVVPTESNTTEAIEICKELGNVMGFKRISVMEPCYHDDMIAFLSQLTHIIAVVLMTCQDNTHLASYTGDSFRDLTRIAKINGKMWAELFDINKEFLIPHMEKFAKSFDDFKTMLINSDREGMIKVMDESFKNRLKFESPER